MIDHVSVAVSDLAAAARFYETTLAPLGYAKLEDRPATVGFGKRYAEFWINLRPSSFLLAPSSGAHVALRAASTAAVDGFHAAALISVSWPILTFTTAVVSVSLPLPLRPRCSTFTSK